MASLCQLAPRVSVVGGGGMAEGEKGDGWRGERDCDNKGVTAAIKGRGGCLGIPLFPMATAFTIPKNETKAWRILHNVRANPRRWESATRCRALACRTRSQSLTKFTKGSGCGG